MHRLGHVVLSCLVAAGTFVVAPPADAAPGVDDGYGSADVTAAAYDWLGADNPSDTYAITLVRGRSVPSVLRILDPKRELGTWTPSDAYGWYLDRYQADPRVTQVEARGPGVVVLDVSGFPGNRELRRLSRRGTVSSFVTTVELDTYVTVARRGRVIRQFDTGFRPPREGALPEERGLGFGQKGVDPWAPAWALNERLTLIHVSREWLLGARPTYVLPRGY